MRRSLLLAVAACTACAACAARAARPAAEPGPPAGALEPCTTRSTGAAPDRQVHATDATREADETRRHQLLAELDDVDAQLAAIDADIAAVGRMSHTSLVDARVDILARRTTLDAYEHDGTITDKTPILLARAARTVLEARRDKLQLDSEYGPQHPLMKRAALRIELAEASAKRQLVAERTFVEQWSKAVSALGAKAAPDAVNKTWIDSLRAAIKGPPPSDSPAEVRIAVERVADLELAKAMLQPDVGPKHPDMVSVSAKLDAAHAELTRALAAADAALSSTTAPREVDATTLRRRGELADKARELRLRYEQLLPR